MTLIALGRKKLEDANRGFGIVAKAEAQEEMERMALEGQRQQMQASTIGMTAGIGGQVGVGRALDAVDKSTSALNTINKGIEGIGKAGMQGDKLTFFKTGGTSDALVGDAAKSAIKDAFVEKAITDKGTELALAKGGAVTGAEVTAAADIAGKTALAEAGAAVEGATAAAAGSSPLAQLATVGAPVAIALGIGYVLSKLFD